MIIREEVKKYLHYCKFQKELDDKSIRAYRIDLEQFIAFMEGCGNDFNKEAINLYLLDIHSKYKQKTVKRKIASVRALFHYLEEEEILELNPFHKVKTKFKEEMILPKIVPRNIIEQLLDYLYRKEVSEECSEYFLFSR